MLSAALIPVALAFIANPMSTWHRRQVYLALWSQWSNWTGEKPPPEEKFLMTTPPYSYGRGRRFLVPVWAWTSVAINGTRRTTASHFFMVGTPPRYNLAKIIQRKPV